MHWLPITMPSCGISPGMKGMRKKAYKFSMHGQTSPILNQMVPRRWTPGRVIWKMLEGAEIIKSTYTGWSLSEINKFKAMLVYPGYSTTVEPTAAINAEDATFYWYMYNGDAGRHGNQGIFAMRGLMAMGIFMDNDIMYERAFRYMSRAAPIVRMIYHTLQDHVPDLLRLLIPTSITMNIR